MGMSLLSYCLNFHFGRRECPCSRRRQTVPKPLSIIMLNLEHINCSFILYIHKPLYWLFKVKIRDCIVTVVGLIYIHQIEKLNFVILLKPVKIARAIFLNGSPILLVSILSTYLQ